MKFLLASLALLIAAPLSHASSMTIALDKLILTTNATTTAASAAIPIGDAKTFSVQALVDENTPAAKTFLAAAIDIATEYITISAHGLSTGLKGQVTNPGTLPTGIAGTTDYFVIVIDANTIQLASSLALAQAGTPVNITNIGAGTNTFTSTAIAGASVKLQKSNDKVTWTDEGSATNITADATVYLEKVDPTAKWMRLYYTLTAGRLSASNYVITKAP